MDQRCFKSHLADHFAILTILTIMDLILSENFQTQFLGKCFNMPPLQSSWRRYVFGFVRPSVHPVLVILLSQKQIDRFLPNLGHVYILQNPLID